MAAQPPKHPASRKRRRWSWARCFGFFGWLRCSRILALTRPGPPRGARLPARPFTTGAAEWALGWPMRLTMCWGFQCGGWSSLALASGCPAWHGGFAAKTMSPRPGCISGWAWLCCWRPVARWNGAACIVLRGICRAMREVYWGIGLVD